MWFEARLNNLIWNIIIRNLDLNFVNIWIAICLTTRKIWQISLALLLTPVICQRHMVKILEANFKQCEIKISFKTSTPHSNVLLFMHNALCTHLCRCCHCICPRQLVRRRRRRRRPAVAGRRRQEAGWTRQEERDLHPQVIIRLMKRHGNQRNMRKAST